jgi:hypothetical protein
MMTHRSHFVRIVKSNGEETDIVMNAVFLAAAEE